MDPLTLVYEAMNKKTLGYHITRRTNLPSIRLNGLLPSVPEEFQDEEGVYFFKSKEGAVDALYNWLGERIEEWEEDNGEEYDEVCLTVDLTGLESELQDWGGYEWIYPHVIPPARIIKTVTL